MIKDIQLTESEQSKMLDEFEKIKKVHKNFFSSFEIITPKVSQSTVKEKYVFPFLAQNILENFWICLPGTSMFFDDMITNYEREMGDNLEVDKKDITQTFYCCVNLMNPNFTKSDRWVVVGFMPVGKELNIPWIWLHPYLRGQGIIKNFLTAYALNCAPLMFETPIKPRLQKIISSICAEIKTSPENFSKYCKGLRKYLEIRYQKDCQNISDEDVERIIGCINGIHVLKPDIDREQELTMLRAMMQMQDYCKGDPEKIKELLPDIDLEDLKNGEVAKTMFEDHQRRMTLGKIADSYFERKYSHAN